MFLVWKLPFDMDKLEPYISKETMKYHYWKHHAAYADKLNKDIAWTEFEKMTLEDIVKKSSWVIYNNAAQLWNHNFYWEHLSPDWGWEPEWLIKQKIEEVFEDFYHFKQVFTAHATNNFWSGWTWLAQGPDWRLIVISTWNADNLLKTDYKPLFVIDVWEHAYYLDYKNERKKYVENFWNIIDWKSVKIEEKKV